jgi:hypothetical protein
MKTRNQLKRERNAFLVATVVWAAVLIALVVYKEVLA